jgi:NTE family protein
LVLAGGGVAGIAWETGVLLGLTETVPQMEGWLADERTRYVGTSAGATVAAQLASGLPLQELFDAQIDGTAKEISVSIDLQEFGAMMAQSAAGATSPADARRRIGAFALAANTPVPTARRAVIESRLPSHAWPTRDLKVTAVDIVTGEFVVFGSDSGVGLVDAVAASCAVPGIWPPVEIRGASYMDGGMRSTANADLAAGAKRVLILVPAAEHTPFGPAVPADQLAELGDADRCIVYADDESLAAMGANPLDPQTRAPAAEAGRLLGRRVAAHAAALWD